MEIPWFKDHRRWYRLIMYKGLLTQEPVKFRVKLIFAWYDFWVGVYVDQNERLVYFFPIPMFGFCIGYQFKGER